MFKSQDQIDRAATMGVSDPNKVYDLTELASGDVMFAATGVTDGDMLQGVRFKGNAISTHTFVMRSSTGTVREIKATHREGQKIA